MKNKFMTRAIELSIESVNLGGGPFGSIIVKNDKVIAEGSNKVTSLEPSAIILSSFTIILPKGPPPILTLSIESSMARVINLFFIIFFPSFLYSLEFFRA